MSSLEQAIADRWGLPAVLVIGIVDLIEILVQAPDIASATARLKQNALADDENLASEAAAEAIIQAGKKL